MYILKTECSIDAAHFLAGYQGKCGNIHGHRWKIQLRVFGEKLEENRQNCGMVVDFGILKAELKEEAECFDHVFVVEKGTLKDTTVAALESEGFTLQWVEFRPTAENLAQYFYEAMEKRGYAVADVTIYETPNNCAVYEK
ncbi:MAG: 6-carboxytetrahydropterin synthase [Lachnospiraceae bacterium]